MDTDTIPSIHPTPTTRHANPVVQALAIITDHFQPAEDGSDDHVILTPADVYDILGRYTAQFVDDRPVSPDYHSTVGDDLCQMASEYGAEDGDLLRTPMYRSDSTPEGYAYRAAYREAADDRIREVLS